MTNQHRAFATTSLLYISLCLSLVCLLMGCSAIPSLFPESLPITPTVHMPQVYNGLLVFTAKQTDETFDVYTMNPDGSDLKRLTDNPGYDSHPVWSSDGRYIFYISDATTSCLDVMNADGTDKHCIPFEFEGYSLEEAVTPRMDTFVWSPDGTKITFDNGKGSIFVMDTDGRNLHKISPGFLDAFRPSWSPDSKQIAFGDVADYAGDIHIVDADGSNYHSLKDEIYGSSKPYWSPDGSRIFFQGGDPAYGGYMTYVMDSDGGNLQRLIKEPASDQELLLGLSPDGSQILISMLIRDDAWYLVVVDTADLSVVARFKHSAFEEMAWSPDGKQIIYWNRVYSIMNSDGTNNHEIVIPFESSQSFSWQPIWK